MKRKMLDILEDYLMSNKVHNNLITKPKNDLLTMLKNYNDLKNRSKALLLLKTIMKKKEKSMDEKKKMLLIKFSQKGQILKNAENASIIQKFLRDKMRNLLRKRQDVQDGLEHLKKGLKLKILEKMKEAGRQNCIKSFLLKYLGFKGVNDNMIKAHVLTNWLKQVNKLKEDEAATKINNCVRMFRARHKLDNLRKRLELLKSIAKRYEAKEDKVLCSRFYDWNSRTQKLINLENAKILQIFCKRKLKTKKFS